jgi:hypothetical protein
MPEMYVPPRAGEPDLSISSLLKRHPFAAAAHFDRAVALSFAFPEAVVRPLVPASLDLDTHHGLAFVTVAMVWTRALRPGGFPAWLGQDFFLAGYRVFTRLREPSGRRLRGLRILRSETDKSRMGRGLYALRNISRRRCRLLPPKLDAGPPIRRADAVHVQS